MYFVWKIGALICILYIVVYLHGDHQKRHYADMCVCCVLFVCVLYCQAPVCCMIPTSLVIRTPNIFQWLTKMKCEKNGDSSHYCDHLAMEIKIYLIKMPFDDGRNRISRLSIVCLCHIVLCSTAIDRNMCDISPWHLYSLIPFRTLSCSHFAESYDTNKTKQNKTKAKKKLHRIKI